MWDNVVGKYIQRCNRKLFFLNAAILGLLLWWAHANERYLYNCWMGPMPIKAEAIEKISNPDSLRRYYVSLSGLKVLETGLRDISIERDKDTGKEKSRTVTASYFTAPAGQRLLLIKSSNELPSGDYQGELELVSEETRKDVQSKLLDDRGLQFDKEFQPVMLDASGFTTALEICGTVGVPLGLLALFNICRSLIRMGNIHATPSVHAMKRFPEGPEAVATSIDQELKNGGNQSCAPSAWITQSWLVKRSRFKLEPIKIEEILWVYQKVVKHSINLIPTGKSHAVIVGTRYGKLIEFPIERTGFGAGAPSNVSARFLQILRTRAPWAMAGYSDVLKREFQSNMPGFLYITQQEQAKN